MLILEFNAGKRGLHCYIQVNQSQIFGVKLNIRLILLGASQQGKSSLLGVLKSGIPDDGHGRARLQVLNENEMLTGKTS